MNNHIIKYKLNCLDRYIKCFASIASNKIFPRVTKQPVQVIACFHFAERLFDRNVEHGFAVKLLSYAFEKHSEKFCNDIDTFIEYKDIIFLINSEKHADRYTVRINTVLNNSSETWIKSKDGKKTQKIMIQLKELMSYVPISFEEKPSF